MSMLKNLCAACMAVALSLTLALAEDDTSGMSMISVFKLDPAKGEQFDDAWKVIKETAEENGYAYTDFYGGSRNERWIATPIKNYADVDALMAARQSVMDAGGRKLAHILYQERQ